MILLAFDVDGTLDSSGGPVIWEKVRALELADPQIVLGIVSPSGARPKDGTRSFIVDAGSRADNLELFAVHYPGALVKLYISNNGDQFVAEKAGFGFITEAEFARALA